MKRSAGAAHLEWLEPESDEGNVEYKLRLKDPSTMRFQQLVTQMKFRLSEGNGECFYYLGEPGASAASASCPLQLRSVAVYDFVELGIVAAGSNRLTLSCNMAANAHILKPLSHSCMKEPIPAHRRGGRRLPARPDGGGSGAIPDDAARNGGGGARHGRAGARPARQQRPRLRRAARAPHLPRRGLLRGPPHRRYAFECWCNSPAHVALSSPGKAVQANAVVVVKGMHVLGMA